MTGSAARLFARVVAVALLVGLLVVPASPVAAATATVGNGLTTTALDPLVPNGLTAAHLATDLAGAGVTVSNVTFKGAYAQAGRIHLVDPAVVSFNDGVILSSGNIADVVGPNKSDGITGDMAAMPGLSPGAEDTDLTALIAGSQTVNPMTYDAAVLEFDFTPTGSTVYFTYTFGSDEYLEWVNLFNDVFAFYVNGTNCATVPGGPVSIDTINDTVNPNLFRDNSFSSPPPNPINIESDGLSVELICQAPVNAGQTNHMKLAIADTSDQILDSVVMIKTGSLSTVPPESCNDSVDNDDDTLVDMDDDSCTSTTTPPPPGSGGVGSGGSAPAFTGNEGTPIVLDAAAVGWDPVGETLSTTWIVQGINGTPGSCVITPAGPQPLVGGAIAVVTAVCPNEGEYVAHVWGWPSLGGGDPGAGGSEFDYDVDFFVHNAPPSVDIVTPAAPATASVGAQVDLAALATDPGPSDSVTCTIDWGDGTTETGTYDPTTDLCTGSHAYASEQTFVLSVTATDDVGDSAADAVLVDITAGGLLPQTIAFTTAPPSSAAYGSSFTVVALGGASGNALVYDASGGCTNTGGTYTMTSSTTACDVTVDQAGDATYAAAPQLGASVNATTREITVTADPATKAFGAADPTLTYAITMGSLVPGDTLSGSLDRDAGEAVGAYAIVQGTLAASADYTLTYFGATFTITGTAPSVLTDPVSQSVSEGTTVTFTAAATGNPAPTVQWEVLPVGGAWEPIPGATAANYGFAAALGDDGRQFRAVFTNSLDSATTSAATLTVSPAASFTLNVAKNGAGSGSVTSSPRGITCGLTCTASFSAGATVTLTAKAPSRSVFAGWSGACSNASGKCVVTMDAARDVTATFKLVPVLAYTGPTKATTGSTLTLTATLKTAAGVPIEGQAIFFRIGTGADLTAVTDASGIASVSTAAPTVPGPYPITTSYTGDASYAATKPRTAKLVVKYPTSLTVASTSCVASGPCALSAVIRVNGTLTPGVKGIRFIVNGRTYTGSASDAGGVSTVKFTAPKIAGTDPITVRWARDATRSACTGSGTLTVT